MTAATRGSFVLSDRPVRPGKYIGRDFQTRLVRRKYSGAPNFTERVAVEGVQVDGGVAFVVREDELPLDLHADKPEVLLIPSSHNETVSVDSDTGRVDQAGRGSCRLGHVGVHAVPPIERRIVAPEVLEGDFNLPPVVTDGGNLQPVAEVLENVVPGLRDCCESRD